jgi:hypothetical protein
MDRLTDTIRLYRRVFAGQEERIPLIVSPPCGPLPKAGEYETDTATAVRRAAAAVQPKVEVGADWLPFVFIANYQCIVVPSFYGARRVGIAGSCDVVEPRFRTIEDAVAAGVPRPESALMTEMMTVLRTAKAALPEGYSLSFPASSSPFDLAQLLVPGEEFLASLLEKPELTLRFLENLTDLCIHVFDAVRAELRGTSSELVTVRGVYFPGLRLPCDAIVNYSPDLLRRFVLPVLARFGERYGKLMIHFCTTPAPSGHVLPVLCESPYVGAVDNWQGPDVFLGDTAPARLQARVAVLGDVDLTTPAKMDAFLAREPVRGVPRRGGRGLVLHTHAASVDEAKQLYAAWQQRLGQGESH